MDGLEVFSTLIRRVLEPFSVYVIIALVLGFFVFRWNANRVCDTTCAITLPC